EAIIQLADNRWLAQSIGDLRKILKLARLQQLHAPGRLAQSLSEHLAVFAALKARDSEGADAAMRTHLTRQREALREVARQQQKSRVAS
ncbi:MAG: FCD domain-containing protein, partial [Variovorax sp.]